VRSAWRRVRATLRPGPAARYVHPKAEGIVNEEGDHDANLDVAEDSAPNYLRWIADRCEPHLGRRVLEVGAGTGSITELYADGREVLAIDRSPWCVDEMSKRFAASPSVTVRKADLLELVDEGQRFDAVVMLNVLEHIEDDVAALQTLGSLLETGGRVVLYVPALNGLYGPWDRKVGHYRRYAPWRMREVLAAAGMTPVELRYMNALSVPAWWAFSHSDVEKSTAGNMSLWDKTGIRMGRRIESIVPVPFGLNLFCAARLAP
jgi:2-polyprenyl-3-methyl-5-hydroxy-6-metoxy-1,4-benzoquinol methylase